MPDEKKPDPEGDRCGICSYSLAAHREQDLTKRRFAMCDRGLEKPQPPEKTK